MMDSGLGDSTENSTHSPPGDTPKIKGYEFQAKLGRGGFATVWHFFDPENGRDVAIKRFCVTGEMNRSAEELVNSLEIEIKILKTLNHERIVKYYDCLYNEPYVDLVLEFVGGVSITTNV